MRPFGDQARPTRKPPSALGSHFGSQPVPVRVDVPGVEASPDQQFGPLPYGGAAGRTVEVGQKGGQEAEVHELARQPAAQGERRDCP